MKHLLSAFIISLLIFIPFLIPAQEEPDKRNVWTGGQKGYVVSGNLKAIKDEKTFNVIVIPHVQKMGVSEVPDSVYVARRVKEWNDEKPGTGDFWFNEWEEAKKNFKPAFIDGLNSRLIKAGINIGPDDTSAEYTFIVHTINMMEFMDKMFIILDVDVAKTTNTGVLIARIKCPVNNSVLESKHITVTSKHAYYNAGRLLGKYLIKNVYQ